MEQTLQLLIQLQEIDSRLIVLEKMKGTLPDELNELRSRLQQQEAQLREAQLQLEKAQSDKRRFELELKALEGQLAKYKEQIYSVKTNKEYDAITAEIETTEIEISDVETQILELLELEEKSGPQLEQEQEKLAQIQQLAVEKEQELKLLLEQSENEVISLSQQRQELAGKISRPVLASYQRIQKGKNGIGVVPIENGVCTGCYSNLPPQTVMEIKQMDRLINCQYCGRFLIYMNNTQL